MEWIVKNLQAVLIFTGGVVFAVIVSRYKEAIKKGTNFAIGGLLSLMRIYFILLKRYKKSVIRRYRETKVGYRNLRLDLDCNYISLKIRSFVHYSLKEADEEILTEKLDVLEVMKKHRHMVILGGPGTGKTTLMQWLLLQYAYGHMKEKLDENLIPIFITLRSLESGQSIDELLPEILKQHHFKGGESFIRKRMEKGKCLLIFDGMDEIVDEKTRKKFTDDICSTYANLYGKSRLIITSHIEEYPVDCFPPSFREQEILDLDMEQVHNFVHGILEPEDKPDELIRQIEKSEGLKKFVTNPLMLSLLTFVYRESHQKLPNDRVKVYNKCMQLMMEDRDRSRGIYEYRNQFDSDDKELLLCKLAYDFSLQNKWRFTEKDILEHWQKNRPPNIGENDLKKLLKEVCFANGILKHFSRKELAFLHRTFQEYFTALEISRKERTLFEKPRDSKLFIKFLDKGWHEITLFLVGMMEDSSNLIQQISTLEPKLALESLTYAKRVSDIVNEEVIKSILIVLKKGYVRDVLSDMAYLSTRYGLRNMINWLGIALEQIKSENRKILVWEIVDNLMLTFSPQKGMAYVPSGIAIKSEEPEEWVPGLWMDIYPVTNIDYGVWIEKANVKKSPRHWEPSSKDGQSLTHAMRALPVVDVTYDQALAYAKSFGKVIPDKNQWRLALRSDSENGNFFNKDKQKYLEKNKLKESYIYYRFSMPTDLNRDFDIDFETAISLAKDIIKIFQNKKNKEHVLALGYPIALAYILNHDNDHAKEVVRDIARFLDRDSTYASSIVNALEGDIKHIRDISRDIALTFTFELNSIFAFARSLNLARAFAPIGESKQIASHFNDIQKAAEKVVTHLEIFKEKKDWNETTEIWEPLLNALVDFLETIKNNIPSSLLQGLRQPGLLSLVTEYSPNQFGIYDLVGNAWEWTTTKNENGYHLICGGAWTEEQFDAEEMQWLPPNWRDINLGFRCVCAWDKIGEVLTPHELA